MGIESAVFFLFFAAVFILFFFAVAGAALFFRRFNENTKYIESNIRLARDKGEYSYWVRELQCHYLCLIPFVGRRNVSRVYRFIFRKPNRDNNKEYCRGIYRILAPSIVGIGICTVCLCGASWAWFNASVGSTMQTIKTPTYQFEPIIVKSNESALTANDGAYTLAADTEYTVEIKTTGTVGATGYCTLVINDSDKRNTVQISAGDTFTFTIRANEAASIKLTGNWGTSSNEGERIANGAEISIGEPKNSNETKTENNAKPAAPVISESKTEAVTDNKSESREESSESGKTKTVTEKASQSQSSGETSSSAGTESDKIPE